jgi:hypothetical protein
VLTLHGSFVMCSVDSGEYRRFAGVLDKPLYRTLIRRPKPT